jgi:hypothetical protein
MNNDMRSILDRISAVEQKLTPATVKKGLNPQQKSVNQLPALFQPKSTGPVLKSRKDPTHPMSKELVGDSVERASPSLAETIRDIEEDMLSKVKRDFVDYLERLENRTRIDQDLKDKAKQEVEKDDPTEEFAEDPTQQDLMVTVPPQPVMDPVLPESNPVKTVMLDDNIIFEIHGDETQGFEIRRGNQRLPSKFAKLDQADTAIQLFRARRRKQNLDQDYLEEK